ncbi:hypothetical protein Ahy_B03g065342 [Arachis hypogaea]|uniref:Putative plant transposon protein domain-containing protein n=1 Tax=Arachis hypogaea TaxID=3818 RepID=A0A445A1D0_ARAHY|nr:hypothetical protein Ahy_B03g065342 [Arachis hypogaea]
MDAPTVFLRGVTLDTSDTALEALLDILHIPPARDAYTQIMKDVTTGKLSLDVVLEKIGQPEARWEYSKGDNMVPLSIACTDLNPETRIWQQIIADYILPGMHATHIRVRVVVLMWAILEGKRISVLSLIRESMWKVNQQQKYNILFPSDYDGPLPKKKKTTEPPSSAVEPSAPPTALAPTPRPQTPYELCREILQGVHRYERHNARRFQWIVAKFEGRDPEPPPSDTPEPEAEDPASDEPAAEAGQAVEHPEQRPAEPTIEEAVLDLSR